MESDCLAPGDWLADKFVAVAWVPMWEVPKAEDTLARLGGERRRFAARCWCRPVA